MKKKDEDENDFVFLNILALCIFLLIAIPTRFKKDLRKHRRRPKRIIQRSKREERSAVLRALARKELGFFATSAKILRKRFKCVNRKGFAFLA